MKRKYLKWHTNALLLSYDPSPTPWWWILCLRYETHASVRKLSVIHGHTLACNTHSPNPWICAMATSSDSLIIYLPFPDLPHLPSTLAHDLFLFGTASCRNVWISENGCAILHSIHGLDNKDKSLIFYSGLIDSMRRGEGDRGDCILRQPGLVLWTPIHGWMLHVNYHCVGTTVDILDVCLFWNITSAMVLRISNIIIQSDLYNVKDVISLCLQKLLFSF